MRLIDADNFMGFMVSLEEAGAEHVSFDDLRNFIKNQPTAYDINKVIEKIALLQENVENNDLNTDDEKAAYNTAYFKAIEAVKSGGSRIEKEERNEGNTGDGDAGELHGMPYGDGCSGYIW